MNPSDERLLIEAIVRDVAELPDRTSPTDWPDAMLVTSDELGGILADRLEQALSTGPARDPKLVGEGIRLHLRAAVVNDEDKHADLTHAFDLALDQALAGEGGKGEHRIRLEALTGGKVEGEPREYTEAEKRIVWIDVDKALDGPVSDDEVIRVRLGDVRALKAALATQSAQLARMAEALKPFARVSTSDASDDYRPLALIRNYGFDELRDLTVGHFRAAARAISEMEK